MLIIALFLVLIVCLIWTYCQVDFKKPIVSHLTSSNTASFNYGPISITNGANFTNIEAAKHPDVKFNGFDKGLYLIVIDSDKKIKWLTVNNDENKENGLTLVEWESAKQERNLDPDSNRMELYQNCHIGVYKQPKQILSFGGETIDELIKKYKLKLIEESNYEITF